MVTRPRSLDSFPLRVLRASVKGKSRAHPRGLWGRSLTEVRKAQRPETSLQNPHILPGLVWGSFPDRQRLTSRGHCPRRPGLHSGRLARRKRRRAGKRLPPRPDGRMVGNPRVRSWWSQQGFKAGFLTRRMTMRHRRHLRASGVSKPILRFKAPAHRAGQGLDCHLAGDPPRTSRNLIWRARCSVIMQQFKVAS